MTPVSWIPTRKWGATLVTALAALGVAWANAGEWNKTLTVALIGVIAQSLVGYLVPNAATPQSRRANARAINAAIGAAPGNTAVITVTVTGTGAITTPMGSANTAADDDRITTEQPLTTAG